MSQAYRTDDGYELLDSGNGRKLERFGPYILSRPCAGAMWNPALPQSEWKDADAVFDRDGGNAWLFKGKMPDSWNLCVEGITFKLVSTTFGHVGVFPEQQRIWHWLKRFIPACTEKKGAGISFLNLFAYSGGTTLAGAGAGAAVCHLDASSGMVTRARENAILSGLGGRPIRWIVDDAGKYLSREIRRGARYDGIVMDPPSFGRGKSGEVFKIETDILALLDGCVSLLSDRPFFLAMSCHTPSFTPLSMEHLLGQAMRKWRGRIEYGELVLKGGRNVMSVPSGAYAVWMTDEIKGIAV
jgi:23S rRNA (cytosine1962-C5)-methyltransferase